MSNMESKKMGEMPVTKLVFNMSLPIIISMVVQALYNVVDSVFVGQYNAHALEAVSLAFPIQNLMIAVAVGIGVGTNALVARFLGARKNDRASNAANAGIALSVIGYAIFAILGIFVIKPFFHMQTGLEEVASYGNEYLSVIMFFGMGIFIEVIAERLLQSTGKSRLSMISQATGAVINIILDPIFIFGYFGLPEMGARGAAIATVIGQIIAAAIAIILNITSNKEIKLSIPQIIKPMGEDIVKILKIGIPSMVLNAVTSISVFVLNIILRGFSESAITAYGIYFKLISFIYMPIFGLNNGLVPIFSYNYGSKQIKRIRKTYKVGIVSAIIYMAAGTLLFEVLALPALHLFGATGEVETIGIVAIRIMALGFIMSGIDIINSTLFQSVGNPMHSLIVNVFRQLIILIPVAFLLSLTGNVDNIWWAAPIAEGASLLISTIFYRSLSRKLKKLEENNAGAEI